MPFKVMFHIWEPGKLAPCYSTSDRRLAYIEWNALRAKPGMAMTALKADVEAVEPLTKAQRFTFQMWEVRKAMHKYYSGGRNHEDLVASLALESALDKKIKVTRHYIDVYPEHPVKDQKAYAFFLLVEEWRNTWHERKKFSQRKGYDLQIYREMSHKLRDYEAKIDSYIKETIGL